jgi:CarD family transcriptional regulator
MTQPAESQSDADDAGIHSFEVDDWAVHPSHGVGKVTAIEEKSFGGTPSLVYVMNIVGSELKVMVPMSTAGMVGLRPVIRKPPSLPRPGTGASERTQRCSRAARPAKSPRFCAI